MASFTRMTLMVLPLLAFASCLAPAAAQYSFRPAKTVSACGEMVAAVPPVFPDVFSPFPGAPFASQSRQVLPPTPTAGAPVVSAAARKAYEKKKADAIASRPIKGKARRSRAAQAVVRDPRPSPLYGLTGALRAPLKLATTAGTNSYNLSSSILPPDQALCVGAGMILEAVNSFVTVRSTATLKVLSGPYAIEDIFGLQDGVISDPRCVFNADTGYFTLVALDVNQGSLLTVATTKTPQTGKWCTRNYYLSASAKGFGPVILDYPTIGWDKAVLSIQVNSFEFEFAGSLILALPRAALESGPCASRVRGAVFQNIAVPVQASNDTLYLLRPYTLAPAGVQEGSLPDTSNGGVIYLAATDDVTMRTVIVAAIRNTSAIAKGQPQFSRLLISVVEVEPYSSLPGDGWPQKGTDILLDNVAIPGTISQVQNVVYAAGKLFVATIAGVNTGTAAAPRKVAAVLYFILKPKLFGNVLSTTVLVQKYVALQNGLFSFLPSLAISPSGGGVITLSISGSTIYPSLGFIELDAATGSPKGNVVVVRAGTAFQDVSFFGPARFGDYSASVWKNTEKTIYLAGETCYSPFGDDVGDYWETRIGRIRGF